MGHHAPRDFLAEPILPRTVATPTKRTLVVEPAHAEQVRAPAAQGGVAQRRVWASIWARQSAL